MRRFLPWFLAILLSVALGCAKPKVETAPPPPKPPEDPWSWMPEGATTIGRVALGDLRKTQLWPLWGQAEAEQRIASWVDLGKVERVIFGGTGHNREDTSYVAAVEGSFSESELRDLAARDQVLPEPRGLITLYRRPEGVWTQITPKLVVTCTPDRVEALVARASAGPGVAVKSAALYRSLAERVGLEHTHFGLIVEDDAEGKRKAALEREAARYGLGSLTREAVRLGVGLDVGPQDRVVAVVEAVDPARAEGLEASVREQLDAVSSNFLMRMLGVSTLLSALHSARDGNYVFVRGEVAETDLNQLLQRFQGALDLADSVGVSVGKP